ncbi:MAG: hypothetical protein LUE14_07825 [Clostridiales bacterium]|nr:hypothetical protein [Clostridiales bacterium]
MSNYAQASRTNYFKVIDENRFYSLCDHLYSSDDHVETFTEENASGETLVSFGCTSDMGYSPDGDEDEGAWCCSLEPFFKELQKILPDGEAAIYTEAGHDKLRNVYGSAWVVTNTQIKYISLGDVAMSTARELLGNPGYTTKLDY